MVGRLLFYSATYELGPANGGMGIWKNRNQEEKEAEEADRKAEADQRCVFFHSQLHIDIKIEIALHRRFAFRPLTVFDRLTSL